jgi:hypothetical protein
MSYLEKMKQRPVKLTNMYAQVVKVHEGADGMGRSKDIEYKLAGRR